MKQEILNDLFEAFPQGCIRYTADEFYPNERSNLTWITILETTNRVEAEQAVIESFSRDVVKEEGNTWLSKYMLEGINLFCKTDFKMADMKLIYKYLGKGINPKLAKLFVLSDYDMNILKRLEKYEG